MAEQFLDIATQVISIFDNYELVIGLSWCSFKQSYVEMKSQMCW